MSISAVSSSMSQIQPTQVTPMALQAAQNDGDGRTGVAALNDGDAAATQARQQLMASPHSVNVHA